MSAPVTRLPLVAAQPGMILAEAPRDARGQALCAAGKPLDATLLSTLRGLGLTEVVIIKPTQESEGADADAARQRLAHLFRRAREEDAWFRALIEDYRLGPRP